MQHISITQSFNAPKKEIFDYLSDHNNLSSILGAQIKRIKNADGDNPNGLGSVRSIGMGIELLQETVTKFEAPDLIEYQISNKVPINYHLGRLEFSSPTAYLSRGVGSPSRGTICWGCSMGKNFRRTKNDGKVN